MSSHMFNEVEESCDRVALIDQGHIIDVVSMDEIRNRPVKEYKIEFKNEIDYLQFKTFGFEIRIQNAQINELMGSLSTLQVKFISEEKYTLERHFREVLKAKRRNQNV